VFNENSLGGVDMHANGGLKGKQTMDFAEN